MRSAGQEVSAKLGGARQLIHIKWFVPASKWTPTGSDVWVMMRVGETDKSYYWNRRTNSTAWDAPAGVEVV